MHRQNLAKRCSAPPAPGQYSFHQPFQLEQQGQGQGHQAQTAQTHTQGRLHALLRQPTGYNHPPSTHTPAPLALALARTRTSSPPPARPRMSSPSRSPRAPHPLAHAAPPLHQHQHQLGMLPPPHTPPDIVDLSSQPPPVDPSSVASTDANGDGDAAGERALAPRPIYDFPSAVVMTEQIRTTRDTSSNRVLNQYLLGHRLGRGQHGDVYKGFDINRGYMVVAIKACRRKSKDRMEELRAKNAMERAAAAAASGASGEGRGLQRMGGGGGHLVDRLQSAERKVLREIAIMKKCKHGQIVQLLEVIDDRLTSKIFMVMEYMGGGEVKWRDSASPNALPVLRVDQARRICRDVILGLEYLHHQGIIHRDIKPANLLWTADRRGVKITDFGVSHFSYAQRLKAVRASEAYRRAVTKKRERIEREKEERERAERMEREKHWRFQGKGRARGVNASGSGSGSSSGRVTPKPNAAKEKEKEKERAAGDEADDEDDADILEALEGTPDPLLLDDGGLSRQAGTPSFLAPEIIWEFRKERQDELVRRVGGLSGAGGSTSATAGTSVGALGMGAGWFGGTRSRSGSDAYGAEGEGEGGGREGGGGEESVSASASASASASLLATHPAHSHSHSPVRAGEARSRSASNPNPDPQEKALPALPNGQDDVEHVPVGVNVIPPSESSRHGDEPTPTPPPRSRSPSPTSSVHGSPTLPSATANTNGRSPTTANGEPNPQPQPSPNPNPELAPSATTTTLGTARPPITKAIDVWALGVTLYCLLCASCPWSGANEFVLYQAVHAQDFRVPPTLGYDAVPAGPRGLTRAQAEVDGEGAFVVWLLERLLEKDVEKRITLDEVKRLPWITRDIPDPEAWLRETSPQRHDPINVTAADESDAMSVLKFTWKRREAPASAVPGASSSPRAAGASGLNRIARAGGRMIKNLLPGRQRSATPGRSLGTLEDAEESDLAVHTDAGAGGGWLRSKSRVDLLSGNRNKGKGRERERDDGEVAATAASSLRRTPSRKRRLAQATVEAVERVTRSGSTRSARSTRRRGKLPELKLSVKSEHTSHSRDSSLSRPGSRAQTPDPRVPTPLQMYAIPPYAVYPSIDEPVGGGPATPRARAGSTSALTSPSTADLSSDDILDEDDERVLEERERERERARVAREAARAEEDERVSRRSSIQKLWMFGRQRSSRSSLAEQNKKGKQRARAGTMGAASSSSAGSGLGFGMGSGAEGEAGSRTFLTRGMARRSEDNMRMGRGPGQDGGPTSYAAATSSMGPRTGSGPAFAGGMGMGMMGMGLTAGTGFDGDGGPLTTGELTNAMRAQSWEGSGAAYAARPEDYDVMSDLDGQSVVYEDEDVRMVGAGGVLSNPGTVPGSPASHSHSHSHSRSGGSLSAQVQSHVDSLWLSDAVASAYGHGHAHGHGPPIPLIHPQGDHLLHPLNVPAIADPALQDPTRAGGGGGCGSYQISSPLAQTPLNSFDESPFDEHYARARRVEQILQGETRSPSRSPVRSLSPSRTGTRSLSRDVRRRQRHADPGYVRYGDEDENSSFESGERVYGQGQTTLQDDIEDSGSDEEEEAEEAIVVRRRRPSESLARSRSQIRRDDGDQ